MEYYVLMVKVATGANKYLVVFQDDTTGALVVYDKWDDEVGALAMAEYLNRGKG